MLCRQFQSRIVWDFPLNFPEHPRENNVSCKDDINSIYFLSIIPMIKIKLDRGLIWTSPMFGIGLSTKKYMDTLTLIDICLLSPGLAWINPPGFYPSGFIRINPPNFIHLYPEKIKNKGKMHKD